MNREIGCGDNSCIFSSLRNNGGIRTNGGSYWVNDARGIPLARGCSKCRTQKLSKYRKDVRTDSNYWADEIVEGE